MVEMQLYINIVLITFVLLAILLFAGCHWQCKIEHIKFRIQISTQFYSLHTATNLNINQTPLGIDIDHVSVKPGFVLSPKDSTHIPFFGYEPGVLYVYHRYHPLRHQLSSAPTPTVIP